MEEIKEFNGFYRWFGFIKEEKICFFEKENDNLKRRVENLFGGVDIFSELELSLFGGEMGNMVFK